MLECFLHHNIANIKIERIRMFRTSVAQDYDTSNKASRYSMPAPT